MKYPLMKKKWGDSAYCFFFGSFLLVSSASFSQDVSKNNWLFSVVVKQEKMRDDATSDIVKYENKINISETNISQLKDIIARNANNGKVKTEQVARQALAFELESRKKYEANKRAAEALQARAKEAIARVRNLLTKASPVNAEIQAVVSNTSGYGQYFSKRLDKMIAFDDAQAGFLEAGDIIMTGINSRAQIHFLDGRGTMDIGGSSKLKIEQSDNDMQVIGLLKGEIHAEIEKELSGVKQTFDSSVFMKRVKKNLNVRTPSCALASRGTKFLVSTDDSAGTEIVVLEDSVAVRRAHESIGDVTLMVNEGYRIKVSANGIFSKPEKIDTTEIERWWEN